MNDKKDDSQLVNSPSVPKEINLSPTASLDLSFLPEKERKELLVSYTKGMVDLGVKAQELNVDASALRKTMDDMSDTVRTAGSDGAAVTVTHTQTSSVGRTEVIMGNTEHAKKGRLSKSQTGETNFTPFYIFGGILALIIIVALNN